ncbi:hypothetical protein NQ317_009902 [Molorchus minor]|uniref:Uncharacterized protein n=1 Tax=Molorchus minor TaxID=1323400 RepID=A0ABQ9IUE3_9CUCU|nr:hypothetical protein NQ317_009902 [Molorchus minor]
MSIGLNIVLNRQNPAAIKKSGVNVCVSFGHYMLLQSNDTAENETVEGLLIQLVHDLTEKQLYDQYEQMEEGEEE